MSTEHMARAAARMVKRWRPAAKQSGQFAGQFMRHVVPAAVKPLHTLWHEILGFTFLAFAAIGVWKIWQHPGAMPPVQLAIVIVFIVVMAGYCVSSIRKSRRISRS